MSSRNTHASGSAAPTPAHPAFPSLLPPPDRPVPPAPPGNSNAVINLIQSLRHGDGVIFGLIPALNATAAGRAHGVAADAKRKEADREKSILQGETALACLDVNLDAIPDGDVKSMSAGLVYILSARMLPFQRGAAHYNAALLSIALKTCLLGDPVQLRACGARLNTFAWGILRLARDLKSIQGAIKALEALLRRVIPDISLSGVHAAFLEACLLAKQYGPAIPVIQAIYVDVKTAPPSYLDVLTFFHHAGLISSAVKDWSKAVEMYSMAVSVPTSTASAIQLACAKRALLCGLMHDGKFAKYTSGSVTRVIERNAKEYLRVVEAFTREDWKTVRGAMGNKEFKDDCNLGILEQVIESIPRRRILRLKETYSRMTMTQLARKLDIESQSEVQRIVERMVASGALQATITEGGSSPVVTFLEEDDDYTSPHALQRLQAVTQLAAWLELELRRGSREMGINREYLKKQAAILEITGSKGGKDGKMDDFDAMMAAEEIGMQGFARGGVGNGGKGKGVRGVGSNLGDMGF